MRVYALIAATLALSSTVAAAQDLKAGEQSFRKCLPCHSVGEGAANKVGPQLNGLEGRKAGSDPNYPYSEANKESGIAFTEETFKEYIKDPMGKVPGTKMAFPGIKNETEIANLWGYLKQFGPDGKIR
jgi:cytochrome c